MDFMKNSTKINILIWVTIASFAMFLLIWASIDYDYKPIIISDKPVSTDNNLKYILIWTNPSIDPIVNFGKGQEIFIQRNCPITNCYMVTKRDYFQKVTQYDVIVFHGPDLRNKDLPQLRSLHQKYVFASMESSNYYPICDKTFNDFFNWTYTYKLNSDELYGYITIKNSEGVIIGPKEEMHWMTVKEMKPVNESLKKILSTKKYAAAWFVSNCHTPGKREIIANKIMVELRKYNLTLDIYGHCGQSTCPRARTAECLKLLETDYYFYLSFENSLSEDYVTEKLLNALQHYVVPIVYGAANYTRYMPDGIYLDASKLTVPELARQMAELIIDKEEYYSYFKWHNHYSYHDAALITESDPYCHFCSMINNETRANKTSVYPNFVEWWSQGKC